MVREYMGVFIYPCGINASGMRWYALGREGYLKANTLAGIKQLIKQDKKGR